MVCPAGPARLRQKRECHESEIRMVCPVVIHDRLAAMMEIYGTGHRERNREQID